VNLPCNFFVDYEGLMTRRFKHSSLACQVRVPYNPDTAVLRYKVSIRVNFKIMIFLYVSLCTVCGIPAVGSSSLYCVHLFQYMITQ
jgi:hypothetical protein